jgi:hypothetical protein
MGKFHSNGKDRVKLDEWFLSPALDQLEELSFNDGHMRLVLLVSCVGISSKRRG